MSNYFKRLLTPPAQVSKRNPVYQGLFKFLSDNVPVFMDRNVKSYIDNAYLINPDAYAIVNKIIKRAAGLKILQYKVVDEKQAKKYTQLKSLDWKKALEADIYKKKALQEVDNTELLNVLDNPNPLTTYREFIEAFMGYMCLSGESILTGMSPLDGLNKGKIKDLVVLPSNYVEVISGGWQEPVKGYRMMFDQSIMLDPKDVLHIKEWNPNFSQSGSSLRGLSPFAPGSTTVSTSNEIYRANLRSIQNGGVKGILSADDDKGFNSTQAQQIEEAYSRKYTGSNNYGKVVIAGSKLKWNQIGLSPVDLNLYASKEASRIDLCNIFSYPAELMNVKDAKTYNNVESAKRAAITDAVLPRFDAVLDGLNKWLVPSYNDKDKYVLDYDINQIPELAADMKELVSQLSQAWWIKGSDKAIAMGYSYDEAIDDYFIPNNLTKLSDAGIDEEAEFEAAQKKIKEIMGK